MIRLETARTIVRDARSGDAETVTAYRSDPGVTRYQRWNPTPEEFRVFIARQETRSAFAIDEWHELVIERRTGAAIIGDVGVYIPQPGDAELGITIAPQFQRNGFASEALAAVCDYLFNTAVARRIIARVDTTNEPSLRLFRSLRFQHDARSAGELTLALLAPP